MADWIESLKALADSERTLGLVRAFITLAGGLLIARLVRGSLARALSRHVDTQNSALFSRVAFYVLVVLVAASCLHQLGFKLGVLLGAAGVLTVALGFASQTSVSNLISGLFLIAERPFVVGDLVRVEDATGFVLSIDLLSVKLRTLDNLFVRIPNESLIKTRITNLTRFPIRRFDLMIGVAYKEDIPKVRELLFEIADRNPICLADPEPLLIFQGFGDSALQLQFSVWAKRENFLQLRNTIQEDIKRGFDAAGIEIPFPHRTLYAGSATEPFPVTIVQGEAGETARDR